MKRFVNSIEEHRWADFCQDMIERRDGKKNNKDCNYGSSLSKYGEFLQVHFLKFAFFVQIGKVNIQLLHWSILMVLR